jgi:hypothetical protein
LWPSEQIISRLHVQTGKNRSHDSDHPFAALIHADKRNIFASCSPAPFANFHDICRARIWPFGDAMPFTFNGCGTRYYGKQDKADDGSYVTTEWITFVYVPLIPLPESHPVLFQVDDDLDFPWN